MTLSEILGQRYSPGANKLLGTDSAGRVRWLSREEAFPVKRVAGNPNVLGTSADFDGQLCIDTTTSSKYNWDAVILFWI